MSSKFVRARPGPHDSVIYTTDDGKEFKYYGGDLSWRTNNPGDLWSGPVSKRNGEIGRYGHFAVFPDYETGHAALLDSLKTTYWNKGLAEMITGYAPKNENKTNQYLQFLRKKTGVKDNRRIRDFTPREFEKLWRAIEQYEGGHSGKIEEVQTRAKITKVRKNKRGTIIAYFVDGMGWLSKAQGIELARKGKVDAVVAVSRAGKPFLRTRPGTPVEIELDHLG